MNVQALVPVGVDEAVSAAAAAAIETGHTLHDSFRSGSGHVGAKSRQVTKKEEALAKIIAKDLEKMASVLDAFHQHMRAEHHFDQFMDQERSEGPVLRQAAAQFKSVTVRMKAAKAAAIAVPGARHIESAHAYVQKYVWVLAPAGLATTQVCVQRLVASLATPAGISG